MIASQWLIKPYPFVADFRTKFIISFVFGLFIYLFLMVFQPFGIENIEANKAIFLSGFGFITFFTLIFSLILLPLFLPALFDLDKWNIGKEIGFIVLNVILITLLNYAYDDIFGQAHPQKHNLLFFIPVTLAVGVIPITIMVFFFEIYLREKHEKKASSISSKIQSNRITEGPIHHKMIFIKYDSTNKIFEIDENDLVFIKSDDNYCKIYHFNNDVIQTSILRITLKNIEKQLEKHPDIIRCHRSYIVNKKRILRISGNARSYNIHFENCKETAAISRSFSKDILL